MDQIIIAIVIVSSPNISILNREPMSEAILTHNLMTYRNTLEIPRLSVYKCDSRVRHSCV